MAMETCPLKYIEGFDTRDVNYRSART